MPGAVSNGRPYRDRVFELSADTIGTFDRAESAGKPARSRPTFVKGDRAMADVNKAAEKQAQIDLVMVRLRQTYQR